MIMQTAFFGGQLQSRLEILQPRLEIGERGCRPKTRFNRQPPGGSARSRVSGGVQNAGGQAQGLLGVAMAEGYGALVHTLRWPRPLLLSTLLCLRSLPAVLFGHESSPSFLLRSLKTCSVLTKRLGHCSTHVQEYREKTAPFHASPRTGVSSHWRLLAPRPYPHGECPPAAPVCQCVAAREAAWLASRQSRSAPRRRHAQAGREAVSGSSLAPPALAAGGGGLGLGDRQ